MNITLESDYAIRIVAEMARKPILVKDAPKIAANTGVSLRFALKILRKLVMAGIVKSYRGAHGGYLLAHDPPDINMRQVIEAIDGEFTMSRCLTADGSPCSSADKCVCRFRKEFSRISKMVQKELEKVTFATDAK